MTNMDKTLTFLMITIFDDDKNFYSYGRFFESNPSFITELVIIVKFPGFSRFFLPKLSNSRFKYS